MSAANGTTYPGDQISRSRTIAVPPSEIFTLLSDPTRHQETEPGDWVRSAIDPEPITTIGQVFGMNMYAELAGGDYQMHNTVTTIDPGRAIAWDPGQLDETGAAVPGGWRWRYDLAEVDGGTEVTLTYDWAQASQETREFFGGFPAFPPEFLERSLESLERAVTSEGSVAR